MSIQGLFNQTATLLRHAGGRADGYGHKADSWVDAGQIVGRLQSRSAIELPRGDRAGSAQAKGMAVESLVWYMGAGTVFPDVCESDRIEIIQEGFFGDFEIEMAQSNSVYSVVSVRQVGGLRGVHHLEVEIKRIK